MIPGAAVANSSPGPGIFNLFLAMENSSIEWCTHSFNPWVGCEKISPGCANCYAEGWAKRSGLVEWGKGKPRRRTSLAKWNEPVRWNTAAAELPARPRVFCASLADWLDEAAPIEWLADLLVLIGATPNLDWLLLTKRPENWRARVSAALAATNESTQWATNWLLRGHAPPNIWIGTTVEDQTRADLRIPQLLKIPARIRFLSCEPLLGPLDLAPWLQAPMTPAVDWIICGGESGPKARPMHPQWANLLHAQCHLSRTPFLFKQWGEWLPNCLCDRDKAHKTITRPQPGLPGVMFRCGKHSPMNRDLNGHQYDGFPALT